MNILMTANCFPPSIGGTEVYSYELARGLSQQPDTQVYVLARDYPDARQWDAGNDLFIQRYGSRREMLCAFFALLFNKKIQKVYVTHRAHFLTLAYLAFCLFKIPYWITIHGTEHFAAPKLKAIVKKLMAAQRIIATSRFVKQTLLDFGVGDAKICIIPPSLDTHRFHPGIDCSELKSQLGLQDQKILVTLCRLVPEKGVALVVKALARVRERLPAFRYFILGTGCEEPHIRACVQELGLQDVVSFVGGVAHHLLTQPQGAYLSLADVFVLTSYEEPFGICYMEAGACGKPVIGCRAGGAVDIIVHQKTGILVTPGSVEEIGGALETLLNDPGLSERLGTHGRQRMVQLFSHQQIHRRIWSLLHFDEV